MRLLGSSGDLGSWLGRGDDGLDVVVELAGEVALEASDGVAFGVSGGEASVEVVDGGGVLAA